MNADHQRRKGDKSWWRRYEGIIQWIALIGMLLTTAHLVQNSQHQAHVAKEQASVNAELIKRLDARQNQLCVAVKKGRVVFKKLVDENGLFIATRVSLIDCPTAKPAP